VEIPVIGKVVSHYKIFEKLGEVGLGVVYRAEDLKLTRTVALKFLPHGLDAHGPGRARFLQEARTAAILNHPNICAVYDVGDSVDRLSVIETSRRKDTVRNQN
jgi:eukaryotic-like serine/threonine-protein kinase